MFTRTKNASCRSPASSSRSGTIRTRKRLKENSKPIQTDISSPDTWPRANIPAFSLPATWRTVFTSRPSPQLVPDAPRRWKRRNTSAPSADNFRIANCNLRSQEPHERTRNDRTDQAVCVADHDAGRSAAYNDSRASYWKPDNAQRHISGCQLSGSVSRPVESGVCVQAGNGRGGSGRNRFLVGANY